MESSLEPDNQTSTATGKQQGRPRWRKYGFENWSINSHIQG